MEYSLGELQAKKVTELRKYCRELGRPKCKKGGYIAKNQLINIIMDQDGEVQHIGSVVAQPAVRVEGEVMVITQNLNNMKVPELRRYMKQHNINIPKKGEGSGKGGNVVKGDLIRAIERADGATYEAAQQPVELPTSHRIKRGKAKRTCYSEVDPIPCDADQVCNASSGRCIKKSSTKRIKGEGLAYLSFSDNRSPIYGNRETLLKLSELLGGTITTSLDVGSSGAASSFHEQLKEAGQAAVPSMAALRRQFGVVGEPEFPGAAASSTAEPESLSIKVKPSKGKKKKSKKKPSKRLMNEELKEKIFQEFEACVKGGG